jgi:predicted nucleotidyltransferase
MSRIEILRCLVGSYAHGLATPDSDKDYRGVFITPTSELLKIGAGPYKGNHWVEGEGEDNTSYELGHFLHLATKSNPTILEVFKATEFESLTKAGDTLGTELRALFPYVWSSAGVKNAFAGYSHNQHKKMFSEKEEFAKRRFKYAVAHIRVLLQAIELLRTNDFSVEVKRRYKWGPKEHPELYRLQQPIPSDSDGKLILDSWPDLLQRIRQEKVSVGHIINVAEYLKYELQKAYQSNPDKGVELDPINEFLLKIRKQFWN